MEPMDLSGLGQGSGPQIDIKNAKPIVCDAEECDNDIFIQVMKFRRVSGLLTQTGKDAIIPIQIFQCTSCGNIPKEFDVE